MKTKAAPEDVTGGPAPSARSRSSSRNSGFSSSQTFFSSERQLRVRWTFAPRAFSTRYAPNQRGDNRARPCALSGDTWDLLRPLWWNSCSLCPGLMKNASLQRRRRRSFDPAPLTNKCSRFFKSASSFAFHHLQPTKQPGTTRSGAERIQRQNHRKSGRSPGDGSTTALA